MITLKLLKDHACSDILEYQALILSQYDKGDVQDASDMFLECSTKEKNFFLRGLKMNEEMVPSIQRELYNHFYNLITE